MTTRITPGLGANLIGQHAQDRNQDATAYVGNLDPQVCLRGGRCVSMKQRNNVWRLQCSLADGRAGPALPSAAAATTGQTCITSARSRRSQASSISCSLFLVSFVSLRPQRTSYGSFSHRPGQSVSHVAYPGCHDITQAQDMLQNSERGHVSNCLS